MRSLTILGAGGHGRVVADIAQALGYETICFVDAAYPDLTQSGIWPVVARDPSGAIGDIAVAIGDNKTRLLKLDAVSSCLVSLIHPAASVSPHAQIGKGSGQLAATAAGAPWMSASV